MADSSRSVLYINVHIRDVSKAVHAKVAEKISEKKLPKKLKDRLVKGVTKVATDLITASKIAEKMAPKMCEEMPTKMKNKGLTIHVEEVFREGPFFVLEMQVLHVDAIVMAEAGRMQEEEGDDDEQTSMSCMQQMFGLLGDKQKNSLESKYLPRIIQSKMHTSMGELLKTELAEKNLEAEADVLPDDKEARFFFQMVQQVREAELTANKGPLPRLLKKARRKASK